MSAYIKEEKKQDFYHLELLIIDQYLMFLYWYV